MLKHVVFFSAKDESSKDTVFKGLKMLEGYKDNASITIYRNEKIDQIANDIDFIVYGEFKDEQSLQNYKTSDLYKQATQSVRPHRDIRIAADFIMCD
jgi:quinol monooxygenase YgiN